MDLAVIRLCDGGYRLRKRTTIIFKNNNKNNNDLVLPGDWEPFQESGPNQRLQQMLLFLALVKEKKQETKIRD